MKLTKTHAEAVAESGVWKRKFAFLPAFMSDGCIIWLEHFEEKVEFRPRTSQSPPFWTTSRRRITKAGTNSGGTGAPTTKEKVFDGIQ